MKRRSRPGRAVLAALLFFAGHEAKAEPRLHGIGSLSLGVSDNPLAAPKNPPEGTLPPFTVVFSDIRPGLLAFIDTPKVSHRFRVLNSTSVFFGHSEANSYSNAVDYNAFFSLSPTTELVLGAGVTQGRLNTFSTLTPAQSTQLSAVQTGGTSFISPTIQQALSTDPFPLWRFTEAVSGGYYTPIFGSQGAQSGQADLRLSLERVFHYDSVGAEGRLGYAASNAPAPDGSPSTPQLITSGVGRWRHDWSRSISSQVDAGYIRAMRATDGKGAVSGLTALAALRYSSEIGSAELSYSRSIQPNLLIGQLFYNDSVSLRGSRPLWHESKFIAAASAGYQHGRILDTNTGSEAGTLDVILADASLSYVPNESLLLSARYQHFEQRATSVDPLLNSFPFSRNIYLATVTVIYPPLPVPTAPYQLSQRVDQDDPSLLGKKKKDDDRDGE